MMAQFQKPGAEAAKLAPNRSRFFRQGDLISLLGAAPIFMTLPNTNVVVAREDSDNEALGLNDLATGLLNKPVYGPALHVEPQELEP